MVCLIPHVHKVAIVIVFTVATCNAMAIKVISDPMCFFCVLGFLGSQRQNDSLEAYKWLIIFLHLNQRSKHPFSASYDRCTKVGTFQTIPYGTGNILSVSCKK